MVLNQMNRIHCNQLKTDETLFEQFKSRLLTSVTDCNSCVIPNKIHCNLVITLMMGAKRKGHYNEMSVITK